MNNDNYSPYQKKEEQKYEIKRQQFFPGGPSSGPGGVPGGGPGRGPGGGPGGVPGRGPTGAPGRGPTQSPPGRGVGGQPTSAPPNFIPELPRMEGQPFGGQRGDGRDREQFGLGDFFRRPGNIRRCMNQFTFIWLFNGNNFWFFPVNIRGSFIEGFRWRRNRWEFDRININRILFFRCF